MVDTGKEAATVIMQGQEEKEEEELPYGGDLRAAKEAKDRDAMKVIIAAKKKQNMEKLNKMEKIKPADSTAVKPRRGLGRHPQQGRGPKVTKDRF